MYIPVQTHGSTTLPSNRQTVITRGEEENPVLGPLAHHRVTPDGLSSAAHANSVDPAAYGNGWE